MPSSSSLANALRILTIDAIQKASSGHPGAPMGMADIAEVLWRYHLIHNPSNPDWVNRDRFVLSNGHGSMLLYSLLHLSGYDLSIDDLKKFRALHSRTPGHPEYGYAPGIETTTGPLGQGLANAVGMALAEKQLAIAFNRPSYAIIDHYTYSFVGDGCLMEGISHEVCSLAGTWELGKLIVFYDDNDISIDGTVSDWFSDNTVRRFESYGWQVIANVDGHNSNEINQAILTAKSQTEQPTLICCKTTIGFGSPNKQGSHDVHGAPLGVDEIALTRKQLNWPHSEPFFIPDEIYTSWSALKKGRSSEQDWKVVWEGYQKQYPELAKELDRRLQSKLPEGFAEKANHYIQSCQKNALSVASRKASLNTLNAFAPFLPELLGGSADLSGSNLTKWTDALSIMDSGTNGRYVHYGVREFGMTAIMNGLCLHKGFIPYGGTFLIFMEYARNAVRMAALMKQRAIFVYTHDSIGLGEDGPTHQPVEQLTNLRTTPNMHCWRPCDAVEAAVAWKMAILRSNGPSSLVFSRQTLIHQARHDGQVLAIEKGGYVLLDTDVPCVAIIIATGSEVELAIQASKQLWQQDNIAARVVSMPCAELFTQQSIEYQASVLPANVTARVAVEAASEDYWYKFVGLSGRIVGMNTFGESGNAKDLFDHFNITVSAIISSVHATLKV